MKNNISYFMNKNLKTFITVFLSVMLSSLLGCGMDNSVAGGPSIGGTGPFTSSNDEIVAMRYETKTDASAPKADSVDNSNLMQDTESENTITQTDGMDASDGNTTPPTATGTTTPEPAKAPSTENNDDKVASEANTDNTVTSTDTSTEKYKITVLNKSVDKQQCAGFERTIDILNNSVKTNEYTSNTIGAITLQTTVKNTTDNSISETKINCNNYVLQDGNNNLFLNTTQQCKKIREVLMFLPKQTHTYSLKLLALSEGNYRVNYNNIINQTTVNQNKANTDGLSNKTCDTFIEFAISKL